MAKEIKQRIVLEGEKQYNQAIKDAQRNLKTLKSELKAETAELGKNATEQQKAETRAASLKKQIAEQEKIVKTLREALEQAKKEYGDNADVVQSWEQKLNNARTTLAGMKNELDGVGQGLGTVQTNAAQATVATKSVADALGNIGSAGESVAGAIEDIFTGLIDTVTGAVEQLWDLISQTAAKANQWTDIAEYWGTDAQTIQKYARAVSATGNSFDSLTGAVTRLVLGGKGKKISEMIGISDENYANEWDYAMAVMDKLYAMRERGENMTPIWEEIFGAKKSTDVMDLLNDWGDIRKLLPQFDGNEGGFGMSDEELQTMNDVWVKINTIEEKWDALKSKFAAGLGVGTLDLLVNVEGTLDGIADYMSADSDEERQQALDKIRTNVEEFFTKLGEIIRDSIHILHDVGMELSESDDPLTSAIGQILVKLSEALQWMVDNADKVKQAFETIFGLWLLAKLGAVAGKLGSILMQIEAIKTFKGLTTTAAAAEAAGSAAGASWGAGFGAAVIKAVPWLAGIIALVTPAETGDNSIFDESGNPTGEIQGLTMTEAEVEAVWQKTEGGDLSDIYDENGKLTETGRQMNLLSPGSFAETSGDNEREQWIRDESRRYREEGNVAADWALRNTEHYQLLQRYWDKYRTSTATNEDWEEIKNTFGKSDTWWNGFLGVADKMRDLDRSLEDLPDEVFGLERRWGEIEEETDLTPEYDDRDRQAAVQDWWDAWKNVINGDEPPEEEESAFEWFQDVFGDDFADVFYRINEKLNEMDNPTQLDDIPEDWWRTTGSWSGTPGENGVTSEDLSSFRQLPAGMQKAVQAGAAAGVSGIKVNLDGRAVGELVAPYVSTIIASWID